MSKSFKNNYLHFTKKERNGTLLLLALVAILALIPILYRWAFPRPPISKSELAPAVALLDSIASQKPSTFYPGSSPRYEHRSYEKDSKRNATTRGNSTLFYFDPNTLDIEGWSRLGVREKTAIGIQHYLEKGGRFREPADIKKIWGIPPALQEKLVPFVQIEKSAATFAATATQSFYHPAKDNAARVADVDINNGDSAAFIALPGIGIKLAARIVNFRNRLGGFYSADQVSETFGLPDSTFQKIKPYLRQSSLPVKQINLNLATEDELKLHPYIRWQLAKVIVQYRSQHGNFSTIEDMKKIMIITDEMFRKMAPYLKVSD